MKKWVKVGLFWGLSMFIIMTFIFPYFDKEEITSKQIIIKFILWVFLGGLIFGYLMRKNFKN